MNHNRIRAAVMGGLDGVITLILGIAFNQPGLALIGMLLAGALSMAIAEFASVAAQRDALLRDNIRVPQVIKQEFNPWDAALSSLLSFSLGGAVILLPLIPSGHHWDSFSYILAGMLVYFGGVFSSETEYGNSLDAHKSGGRLIVAAAMAIGISYGVGVWLG